MSGIAPDAAAVEEQTVSAVTRTSRVPANGEDWKAAAEPLTTIIKSYINHPGVGTIALGAFLVLKGYVLSKGNIPIALGILQNAGLPTIVIGGLLSGLPILVAAMLAGTVLNALTHRHREKKSVKGLPLSPQAIVVLAAVALSLIFTQWPVMVIAAVIGLVIGAIHRMNVPWLKAVAYLVTLIFAVYGLTVMLYTVWLPLEKLTISTVKSPPVGYVLADNPGGWITILLSQQHSIVSYRDVDVTSRQTCEQAPYNAWSQLTDAVTLWQQITEWSPLSFLHQTSEPPC